MIDRYKMIIWAKPRDETLEEQINCVYNILNKLKEYNLFSILLLPVKSKKEVTEFDIKKENIEALILSKRDKKFPDLGSELSFFTSLDEENSLSIEFSVGRSNVKFTNTMVISFPVNLMLEELIGSIELLKDLVKLYNSFYACITSNLNLRLFNSWFDYGKKIPKAIFWVNYWGKDIVNTLKVDEKTLTAVYESEVLDEGYYIRLQKEPIDTANSEHVELQKKANQMFGL